MAHWAFPCRQKIRTTLAPASTRVQLRRGVTVCALWRVGFTGATRRTRCCLGCNLSKRGGIRRVALEDAGTFRSTFTPTSIQVRRACHLAPAAAQRGRYRANACPDLRRGAAITACSGPTPRVRRKAQQTAHAPLRGE
ncbi:hypothetical protein XMIN_4125 [Xanthomonas citri pv. mangiferaeindicae LMG 941]|nr:hypothetical protein XMIN_4125 [Xanthomonas citri pv. mangiferaeindicae LMG 941]